MERKISLIYLSCVIGLIILHLLAVNGFCATITVAKSGGDYTTIQAAINAASSGDTIRVGYGVYNENIVIDKNIDLLGDGASGLIGSSTASRKKDSLPSEYLIDPIIWPWPPWYQRIILFPYWWLIQLTGTTISGDGTTHVVRFNNVTQGRLDGFTIKNSGPDYAGIYLNNSTVDISNCRVTENGDGIYTAYSPSIIRNCIIDKNSDTGNGVVDYGICCLHSGLAIFNNLIVNNNEVGIYVAWPESGDAMIINNTIENNGDDGVWCYKSSPTVKNNIITNNQVGIIAIYNAAPKISYNNVWNNTWMNYNQQTGGLSAPGTGDISEDPLFADPNNGDYRLGDDSPCIDAGDPDPVYNDPDGTRNDMGAYGGIGATTGPAGRTEGGFVFTEIGRVPVSEIPQDSLDPSFGLAKVNSTVASKIHIPAWTDCPFGGDLWLYGMFGETDDVDYYQILVAKWNGSTPPDPGDFVPLNTGLTKVRYDIVAGKVIRNYITLGPKVISGINSLYELHEGGYWTQPSLRMVWKTRTKTKINDLSVPLWENGKYSIKYKAYRWVGLTLTEVTHDSGYSGAIDDTTQNEITVVVNNSPVNVQIHMVKYDPGNPNYNPINDGEIEECAIIRLDDPNENLRFVITASHPEGYLHSYKLDCLWGKNNHGGNIMQNDFLNATPSSPHIWPGVNNLEFDVSTIPAWVSDPWEKWKQCAYQFRLYAIARTIDGNHRLYDKEFNDHYYIDLEGLCSGTGSGVPGDLNGDGLVTIDELMLVLNAYMSGLP